MTCTARIFSLPKKIFSLGEYRAGNLSQSNQPPRSTQPGHPSVGRQMSTGQRAVMLCNWE